MRLNISTYYAMQFFKEFFRAIPCAAKVDNKKIAQTIHKYE